MKLVVTVQCQRYLRYVKTLQRKDVVLLCCFVSFGVLLNVLVCSTSSLFRVLSSLESASSAYVMQKLKLLLCAPINGFHFSAFMPWDEARPS